MVLILMLKANSGANPNPPWLDIVAAAFLDGCSRTRNQSPGKNLPIL
jgi:hypothetical protein